MARPRILILSTAYSPMIGGSELAIQHIADRIPEYDFDVVTGRHSAGAAVMEQIGRVRVFRAGGNWARLSFFLPKILLPIPMAITAWRLMRSHPYVCVHAYQASQAAGAGLLLKFARKKLPLIVTLQEGKDLDRQSWMVRMVRSFILRHADYITAISTTLANYGRRHSAAQIEIVPNGVDTETFARSDSRPPGHTIITVSRLVPKNGIEDLLRALPHVARVIPDVRCIVIGDGLLRSSLELLASDLHIAGSLTFLGSIPHVRLPEYLHGADVFVRPSHSEGLGNAFLEAMAAGVPIIGTSVGGIRDFLEDEKTGLVCNPSDPEDIAQKIVRIFQDHQLAMSLADRARILVRERYDWRAVAGAMRIVYDRISQTFLS